jgi:excisionase family DNA binding protein
MDAQHGVPHAFSVNQVAKALNISRRSVYNMLASGKLHAVRVGARQRIPAEELDRLCRPQGHDPATAPGDAGPSVSATDGPPCSPATLAELVASPAAVGAIAPPQKPPPAGRDDAPVAPAPATPVERPRLSDLLAQTREASLAR